MSRSRSHRRSTATNFSNWASTADTFCSEEQKSSRPVTTINTRLVSCSRPIAVLGEELKPSLNHQVTALVIRTGCASVKGEIIRSILYPRPIGFSFYEDCLKFVMALCVVAAFGMVYCAYVFIRRGVSPLWRLSNQGKTPFPLILKVEFSTSCFLLWYCRLLPHEDKRRTLRLVRLTKVKLAKVRLTSVRLTSVRFTDVRLTKGCSTKIRLTKGWLTKVRLTEDWLIKIWLT